MCLFLPGTPCKNAQSTLELPDRAVLLLCLFCLLAALCRYEGPNSTNPLSFRYYNAEEVVLGKKMKDW
jgi:hypothetical protein